jgi:hypothetical protein
MANRYATQGRVLIDALMRRPHTYLEMLEYGLSTSPWKRVSESVRANESLVKGLRRVGNRYLTTWRVVRAR